MKLSKESILKKKTKGLLLKIIDVLDNNNNANAAKNGEDHLIDFFFSKLKKEQYTLFDIGANVGKYSKNIIDVFKHKNVHYSLHAFEPTQKAFDTLKQTIGINDFVVLNNFGVSSTNGSTIIYSNTEGSALSSLYQRDLSQLNIALNKEETIQLRRLDEYINLHYINHIDFMKIDVEGHELEAFKGLGKFLDYNFISAIQFEYGGANLDSRTYLKDFYKVLEEAGFIIYKIKPSCLEKRGYNTNMENFRYANYIAFSKKIVPLLHD